MKFLIFVLSLCFILSSCSSRINSIENILEPPRISDEHYLIYSALENSVGKNIKLHYSRQGDNRSSFLIQNIDGESSPEAIVFYTSYKKDSSFNEIRINVLDYIDDKWVSIYDMSSGSSQVDKIMTFKHNDEIFITIGFNMINQVDKIFNIYKLNDKILENVFNHTYSIFQVLDMDNNGIDELFFVSRELYDESNKEIFIAKNLIYEDGMFKINSQVNLDPSVNTYSNIMYGNISKNRKAIFLDGVKGTDIISTQIIMLDSNKALYNALYSNNSLSSTLTDKFNNILPKDIDGDGIIEIVSQQLMRGYENEKLNDKIYLTNWNKYDDITNTFKKAYSSYISPSDGYNFVLPDNWNDKITVKKIIENNEVIFYKYNVDLKNSTEELLKIRTVSRNSLSSLNNSLKEQGYVELDSSGQIVYMIKLYDNIDNKFKIDYQTIKNLFNLYI